MATRPAFKSGFLSGIDIDSAFSLGHRGSALEPGKHFPAQTYKATARYRATVHMGPSGLLLCCFENTKLQTKLCVSLRIDSLFLWLNLLTLCHGEIKERLPSLDTISQVAGLALASIAPICQATLRNHPRR